MISLIKFKRSGGGGLPPPDIANMLPGTGRDEEEGRPGAKDILGQK